MAVSIKTAVVSVHDKTGIVDFSRTLRDLGVELLSTGGTAKLLTEKGIAVQEIAEYTGFPEIFDGRAEELAPENSCWPALQTE